MNYQRTKADESISRGEIIGHLTSLAYNVKTLDDLLGEVKPFDHVTLMTICNVIDKMKEHADEIINETSK